MKWLKLHNDIIHDPKIRVLAFEDRWHFVALLVLTNDGTLDEPKDVRDMLVEVALGLHGVDLANLKNRLQKLRLIGDDWKPTRWEMRQAAKDKTGAERQKRFRENQVLRKQTRYVTGDVTEPLRTEEEVEEELYIAQFDAFWSAYPKKVDRKKAKAKFQKLKNNIRELVVSNVQIRSKSDRQWLEGYAPNPTTYLNGSRWEDEWQRVEGASKPMQHGVDYV